MKRIALVLVVALLSGCASIPYSSRLTVVEEVSSSAGANPVRVIARPPSASMTPDELINGFIAAQASISDDFAIARKYLTTAAARTWHPKSIHLIDVGRTQTASVGPLFTNVSTQVLGTVDKTSRLSWSDSPRTLTDMFTLVETDKGLRISEAPNRAFMSPLDFTRNYVAVSVYMLSQDFSSLVPDVVWLADGDASSATRLGDILLAGPAGALKTAVASAIPNGTRLSPAAVTVMDRQASVNLDSTALQVTDAQRQAMLAQITWTLTSLDGVDSVRITVANQPVSTTQLVFTRNQFDVWVSDNNSLARPLFSVTDGVAVRGTREIKAELGVLPSAQSLAVTGDGAQLAFVSSGRAFVAPVTALSERVEVLADVVDIDFDARKRLWLVTTQGTLWVQDGVRPAQQVLGVPDGQRVIAMSNAPDGARAAVVMETPAGRVVRIFGVNTSGTTVALTSSLRIDQSLTTVSDVAWLDNLQVLVVGQRGVEEPSVFRINLLSTQPMPMGGPSGIAQLTATYGQPPAVLTSQGMLWVLGSNQWQSVRSASAIAYAG